VAHSMTPDLLDTWPAWQQVWARVANAPLEAQIDAWATDYMALYPTLFAKQVADYASAGLDWRAVARERVFPHLAARTPRMIAAHQAILRCHSDLTWCFRERLGADFTFLFVVYVGLECGAGWATMYEGLPACLLGLEAIANLGWESEDQIQGLIAHELGHLAHMVWRERAGVSTLEESEAEPLFRLYSEGLASRAEQVIRGQDTQHLEDQDGEWLAWCRTHESWLAGEYLRRVDAGADVRDFFGSWFAIAGHSQTGYYLGHQVVQVLERQVPTLRALAVWPAEQVRQRVRAILQEMATPNYSAATIPSGEGGHPRTTISP